MIVVLPGLFSYFFSEEVKSVVFGHCNHLARKFSVDNMERQDKLHAMYWLLKLHKKHIKQGFC